MNIKKKFYSISEIVKMVGQQDPLVKALIKNAREVVIERGEIIKDRAALLDWMNSNVQGIATFENPYASEEANQPANSSRYWQVSFELDSDLAMFLVRFS